MIVDIELSVEIICIPLTDDVEDGGFGALGHSLL